MSDYKAENFVAKHLNKLGAQCHLKNGTPGIMDVVAGWATEKPWRIQVRSTEDSGITPDWLTSSEIHRLELACENDGHTPVIAWLYANDTMDFYSPGNGDYVDFPEQ